MASEISSYPPQSLGFAGVSCVHNFFDRLKYRDIRKTDLTACGECFLNKEETIMVARRNAVAVVVGRFQGPRVHEGQQRIPDYAVDNYQHVLVVLGSTGGMPDRKNPLPFAIRQPMVFQAMQARRVQLPHIIMTELLDHPISKEAWSAELVALIAKYFPGMEVAMCGGRDSFLLRYTGKHPSVLIFHLLPMQAAPPTYLLYYIH